MKLNVFFAGAALLSLASCTNLGSFQSSYESLCGGKDGVTEFDACFKGRECYESSSLLIAFPRAFGTEGYESFLARYTAAMLTLHEGTYNKLKKEHFITPLLKRHLAQELKALSASPAIQPEGKARILRELELMGPIAEAKVPAPAAAAPAATEQAQPATQAPAAVASATPAATQPKATASASEKKAQPRKTTKTKASPVKKTKPRSEAPAKTKTSIWDTLPQ